MTSACPALWQWLGEGHYTSQLPALWSGSVWAKAVTDLKCPLPAMQGGNVWEKAGVNVSVVYGSMPPEAYRAATGTAKNLGKENGAQDRVPFFACGISSVMHPHNPFAPTMHFNYR